MYQEGAKIHPQFSEIPAICHWENVKDLKTNLCCHNGGRSQRHLKQLLENWKPEKEELK